MWILDESFQVFLGVVEEEVGHGGLAVLQQGDDHLQARAEGRSGCAGFEFVNRSLDRYRALAEALPKCSDNHRKWGTNQQLRGHVLHQLRRPRLDQLHVLILVGIFFVIEDILHVLHGVDEVFGHLCYANGQGGQGGVVAGYDFLAVRRLDVDGPNLVLLFDERETGVGGIEVNVGGFGNPGRVHFGEWCGSVRGLGC